MIEVKNLTKKYGNHAAVRNLSFNIEDGRIYGLLGPNGAGKSTTMNIITGCLSATSGTVLVDGHDIFEEPTEAKRHIGYLPELPPLYTDMTPKEYLVFVAEAKGVPFDKAVRQIKEVMDLTGITDVKDRLIRNLSKGYRQRVGIAQAMLGDPDVIILDEPTVGLDPKQIIEIRDLVRDLGKIKTVVISSHILAEISAVCDHVLIISHGRLVADDSLENLEQTASRANGLSVELRAGAAAAQALIESVPGAVCTELNEKDGISTALVSYDGEDDLRDLIFCACAEAGVHLVGMSYRETTLESIFLSLTSEEPAPAEETGDEAEEPAQGTDTDAEQPQARPGLFGSFGKKARRDLQPREEEEYTPLFGGDDADGQNGAAGDDTDTGDDNKTSGGEEKK